jgi:hypothetical protein
LRKRNSADIEALWVARTADQIAARRVRRAAVQMQHFVPTPGQFTAKLHLKRVAGVVVDDYSHDEKCRSTNVK